MGCTQTKQCKVVPEACPLAGKTLLSSKGPNAQPIAKKPSLSIEVPSSGPPTDTDACTAKVILSSSPVGLVVTAETATEVEDNPDTTKDATSTGAPTATELEGIVAKEFDSATCHGQAGPLDSSTSIVSPLPSPLASPLPSSRSWLSAATTRSTFSFAAKGTRGKVRPSADEIGLESILDASPQEEADAPSSAEKVIEAAVHAIVDAGESLWSQAVTAWNSKEAVLHASEEGENCEDAEEDLDEEGNWVDPVDRAHMAFKAACA